MRAQGAFKNKLLIDPFVGFLGVPMRRGEGFGDDSGLRTGKVFPRGVPTLAQIKGIEAIVGALKF